MTNLSSESHLIVPAGNGCHLSISDGAVDTGSGVRWSGGPPPPVLLWLGSRSAWRNAKPQVAASQPLIALQSISAVSLTHLGQQLGVQCLVRSEFPDCVFHIFSSTVGQLINSALKMEAVCSSETVVCLYQPVSPYGVTTQSTNTHTTD
jgi:hypothetical protein